ncbi:MAG: GWxTD domain-containing protein [FCB group bacterium]|nr:GWxTD domain-containing protein [FCB group bacterium]
MKNTAIYLALLIMIAALNPAALAVEDLTIQADYAVFYNPDNRSANIEFYYGLYQNQLGFIGADTLDYRFAGVYVSVGLYDDEGGLIDSSSTYFLSKIEDTVEVAQTNQRLFDYLLVNAAPGSYRAEISVIDDVSKASGRAELKVTVPPFDQHSMMLSGMELAYYIRDIDENPGKTINPRLVKENRLVVPNPSAAYQLGIDSVIYVYSELYGLERSGTDDEGFVVNYKIKDELGTVVHDFGEIKYDKPGASAVLSNALGIEGVNAGDYFLSLEINDPSTDRHTLTVKPFTVVAPLEDTTAISAADAELMVNIAWYHLSEADKIQIRKLDPLAQKNMLLQFWRRMDDDPTTPENPFYNQVVQRYMFAIDKFSTHSSLHDGWHTDRGRVYITYGPYDSEVDLAMQGMNYPMIKWEYYKLEGGVIFIFASDPMAGGIDYRLVHSTHPREKYDPSWETKMSEEAPEESWKHGDD